MNPLIKNEEPQWIELGGGQQQPGRQIARLAVDPRDDGAAGACLKQAFQLRQQALGGIGRLGVRLPQQHRGLGAIGQDQIGLRAQRLETLEQG